MIALVWNKFLFLPLINALIYLYNNYTDQNIVWAVVILTIALRTFLIPFSILSERNKLKYDTLETELNAIEKQFGRDPVKQRELQRALLHKNHISPWAKTIVLLFQVILFFVLYRVFLGGIRGKITIDMLYPQVDYPQVINTDFYGFDASERSLLWAGIVGIVLFLEIWWEARRHNGISKKEIWYAILFPLSAFFALSLLPMVKSVFVLTTIFYSVIISGLSRVFSRSEKTHH